MGYTAILPENPDFQFLIYNYFNGAFVTLWKTYHLLMQISKIHLKI